MHPLPPILLLIAILVSAPALQARAEPPSSKTIRQWTGSCDNHRACSAFGFATTVDETMIGAWIRLDRQGDADAFPSLSLGFSLADGGDDTPKTLVLAAKGGPSFGPFAIEEGDNFFRAPVPADNVPAILALLRKVDFLTLAVTKAEGSPIEATLSLDGASAAMLWLDDEQQRIGTKTALVKRGAKPASAIPPVPALPVIQAAASTAEVPQTLPNSVLELAKTGDCADAMDQIEPIVADLGGGRRLYGALCGSGAYSFSAQFWIAGSDGVPAKASFVLPPALASSDDEGGGLEEQGILINPSFDEKTMTLSAFAKGRGIADCGETEDWVWDGEAFRLSSYTAMTDCQGVPPGEWPVMYRAEVR
ncbi:hypothetical protein C3941_17525 [Kaistia algarum]|uniref:DUF1176 domain-containing protein n=1 Tax=Kaistia algarum TaxID=2083279 RepID=UPI000CE7C88A|nr:DUF1176 domain-containing protein [Kaistia algarum]MCX5516682.1 DUF1176 domain-containing protein [Kaistia algarum]PPE78581.1 hypothetical protein C3941_17525 [Kaistia algarum]